jgi:hypothetical protein
MEVVKLTETYSRKRYAKLAGLIPREVATSFLVRLKGGLERP